MLAIAQLLKMLCFVACSTRPALRKNLRRIVYLVLALIAGGFCLFHAKHGLGWWEDALAFFNALKSRLIPFWGWIKGFVMYAAEGKGLPSLLCFAGTLLGGGALAWLIWHMQADFYEEALQKASEKSEMMAAAQDAQSGNVIIKRKKDRSEKIRRNAFHHGWGAGVFFHKPLYNRFRFAHLGIFTKTLEFNLAVALGGAALCRFVLNTENVWIIVILLALGTFFRSLGNSLREDTQMWYFLMIPEDNWSKLICSLGGDLANSLLDVLPALFFGLLLQGAKLFPGLLWGIAIVSVSAYATSVGTFIDLSVSVNAGQTLKSMVQLIFIYFGILPDLVLAGILISLGQPFFAMLAVTAFNLALSALFLYFASLLMGRK